MIVNNVRRGASKFVFFRLLDGASGLAGWKEVEEADPNFGNSTSVRFIGYRISRLELLTSSGGQRGALSDDSSWGGHNVLQLSHHQLVITMLQIARVAIQPFSEDPTDLRCAAQIVPLR